MSASAPELEAAAALDAAEAARHADAAAKAAAEKAAAQKRRPIMNFLAARLLAVELYLAGVGEFICFKLCGPPPIRCRTSSPRREQLPSHGPDT